MTLSAALVGLTSALALAGLGFATWKQPRLVCILVWSGVTAILLTAALLVSLDLSVRAERSLALMALPVVWVTIQFLCSWFPRPLRVLGALAAVSLASAAFVVCAGAPVG